MNGGVVHLVVIQPQAGGVQLQVIAHLRQPRFNFQQVGHGLRLGHQLQQTAFLGFQGGDLAVGGGVVQGNVLPADLLGGDVGCAGDGLGEGIHIFGGDPNGQIGGAVPAGGVGRAVVDLLVFNVALHLIDLLIQLGQQHLQILSLGVQVDGDDPFPVLGQGSGLTACIGFYIGRCTVEGSGGLCVIVYSFRGLGGHGIIGGVLGLAGAAAAGQQGQHHQG